MLAALSILAILTLARPVPPVAVTLTLGVAVFAVGTLVAARERIPSYGRFLGVYVGVFGLAGFASLSWNLTSAVLVVIGSILVFEVVHECLTVRSADILSQLYGIYDLSSPAFQ